MRQESRGIFIIIGLFIIICLGYSLIVPVFNAPDEPFHFEYIRFLAVNKRLTNQGVEALSISAEGFNPPLYYLVGAVMLSLLSKNKAADIGIHEDEDIFQFCSQGASGFSLQIYPPLNPDYIKWGRGTQRNMFLTTGEDRFPFAGSIRVIHILRIVSIILGALTVFFTFKTSELMFPKERNLALLAAAVAAFNPQFTFLSSALNNDNMVTMFSAASLWCLAKFILMENETSMPKRWLILLGTLIGLGLITKVNISFIGVISIIGIVYKTAFSQESRRFKRCLGNIIIFLTPIAAISGWYFLRNILIYGIDDPLGWKLLAIQNPGLVMPVDLRSQFFKYSFLPTLFTSFWGRFDWLTIWLPTWLYLWYGLMSLTGIAGMGHFIKGFTLNRKDFGPSSQDTVSTCVTGCLFLAGMGLAIVNLIILSLNFISAQGRLIFPILPLICLFIAMGISGIIKLFNKKSRLEPKLLLYSFILVLIGFNLYSLLILYSVYR